MENPAIYIIAEIRKGCITQETYELLRFASAVGDGTRPVFLLLGKKVEEQAREISQKTGCDSLVLMADHLEHYNALSYAHALVEILQKESSAWVCLPHTSMGYDLAPRLAVPLKAACITGVESVGDGSPETGRAAQGGLYYRGRIGWRWITRPFDSFRKVHRRDRTENSPGGGDRASRGISALRRKDRRCRRCKGDRGGFH